MTCPILFMRFYNEKITNVSKQSAYLSRALREVFRRLSAKKFTTRQYQSLSSKLFIITLPHLI